MKSVRYDQPVCSYAASYKATAHLNEATSDPMMRDGNVGTLEQVGKPKPKGSGGGQRETWNSASATEVSVTTQPTSSLFNAPPEREGGLVQPSPSRSHV